MHLNPNHCNNSACIEGQQLLCFEIIYRYLDALSFELSNPHVEMWVSRAIFLILCPTPQMSSS